ncbi:MAG TPA: hypothetical protein VFC63_01885 [Blastocatellia bacterium]|nr:hypothetical protein [Blastocatellia bacterium]
MRNLNLHRIVAKTLALILLTASCCAISYAVLTGRTDAIVKVGQSTSGPKRLVYQYKLDNVLKIKDVGHLDDPDWAKNLEFELENTSGKPIYHIQLFLKSPDWKAPDGIEIDFVLSYGSFRFINNDHDPDDTDVPIKPGETVTIRIPKEQADAFEKEVSEGRLPDTKRLVLQFHAISFGDRTGYINGQITGPRKNPVPRPDLF